MKKCLLPVASLAIAALPLLTSCTDSYPEVKLPVNEYHVVNTESLDKTPIMVFVNPQHFFSISATRSATDEFGSGAFDSDDAAKYTRKYNNSDIYVYAFRTGIYREGTLALVDVDYRASRWNPQSPEDKAGKNCLLDGPGGRGLRAHFSADRSGALDFKFANRDSVCGDNDFVQYDRDNEHGYMSYFTTEYNYEEVPYNFFGYYIDNVDSVKMLDRSGVDSIQYRFDIDGSQDILCGYAPFSKAVLDEKPVTKNLSGEEYRTILTKGGFSTYSAQRLIYPEIKLNHQLVRFDFKAYPGDGAKVAEVDDIMINAIGIECPVTCTMTVAHKDTSMVGTVFENIGWLYLREASEDGVKETKELEPFFLSEMTDAKGSKKWAYANWRRLPAAQKIPYRTGGCLMVPVTENGKYNLKIFFSQRIWDETHTSYELKEGAADYTLSLPDDAPFVKGQIYSVYMAIKGYDNIEVSVGQ